MKKPERLRTEEKVLILTLFVQMLFLVNQTVVLAATAKQTMTASMVPTTGRESLQVHIQTDTGRPEGILDHITRYLQGQSWFTDSWVGAWLVDGVERSAATVAISITVTGSNVLSTATVNYYIEARPVGGGQPYRFLEATGQSATVGGAAIQASDNRGITGHLEAMSLATTQSWTIDYYVYAKALATGAVSGETLTSEIVETKFDTKTYVFDDPGTWTILAGVLIDNWAGFASSTTYYPVATDSNTRYFRVGGGYDPAYWAFRNDARYGPQLPYVDPGSLVIKEAYIQMHSGRTTPSSTMDIYIHGSHATWQGNWITSLSTFNTYFTNAKAYHSPVTWTPPYLYSATLYNTVSVAPLIQYKLDINQIPTNGAFMFWFDLTGTDNGQMYFYPWPATCNGRLYIRWSQYTASWQPLPPLSLAQLPITLDVVALTALIAATALVLRESRRKKR